MTIHLMAKSTAAWAIGLALGCTGLTGTTWAQSTSGSAPSAVAAEANPLGIARSELLPGAPQRYTVKNGDTLWGVAKLYLKTPWRWPELWGIDPQQGNAQQRIYPDQVLLLESRNGMARLRLDNTTASREADIPTVRVSPRNRMEALPDNALPTLRPSFIEPFLAEPIIIDASAFASAARIVSAQEGRVLLSRGDRAYARGEAGTPLLDDLPQEKMFRVFRTVTPLKDPQTGKVLGYEAVYAGKARLLSSESSSEEPDADGKPTTAVVPARIDIVSAKEEIRVGDRLLPEPPRQIRSYTPHAPQGPLDGRIVSVYGSAVNNAAQNQVVVINRGSADGLDAGTVLAILKNGARVVDKQDPARPLLKLPDERNGLMMVFLSFERLSYALILDITDGVRVGDRLASPR